MKPVFPSMWCVGVLYIRAHSVRRKEAALGDASLPASLGRCCSIRLSSLMSASTCVVMPSEMKIFLRQCRLLCPLYSIN